MSALLVAMAIFSGSHNAAAQAQCGEPATLSFRIDKKITRSELGFTQGLEFRDGKLYESTGRIDGTTRVNTIGLDGKVTTLVELGTKVFGEGLTILNDEIIQLTWQEHQVFAYDLAGKALRQMANPREGWGLSNNGKELIFSDGGESIYYADPKTFAISREVKIRTVRPRQRVIGLNELEFVGGKLYGNIFTTPLIVRLDPTTGCIDAAGNMGVLWSAMDDAEQRQIGQSPSEYVLNGIAYDAANDTFYLTGKRWPVIFVGKFSERK
jgi:glutamine cyclotransferase